MKLTRPQRELLALIVANGPLHASDTYPPAKKLVAGGYAQWIKGKYSDTLGPTEAGRALLSQEADRG